MRQGEEKKKDHRLIRSTPSIQTLGISEGTKHTSGKEHIWCFQVQDPDVDGVRPTQSPDPVPGVAQPLVRTHVTAGWAPKVK